MSLLSSLTSRLRRLFVDKPSRVTYSTTMAITIDEEYKNNIGCKITLRFADAIEQKEVPVHEIEHVSRFVTESLSGIKTKEELINFLRTLAIRWPVFEPVFHQEVDQIKMTNAIEDKILNRSN